jgi:hypothetical protein
MGGLVSRRMIQRHPELWAAMDDPAGRHRGGRLVMLGTPNRGSYSIPLTLTGDEFMVKLLDVADLTKGRRNVLARLNSFPGTYQMLPSPEIRTDLGGAADDHGRLFDPAAWGDVPVQAALLARAQRFARELHGVVDAERMVYVAGYGEGTPSAIRVRAPGRFEYQRTTLGDGRVPHALGLLPGVPAYYVRESHGDLPKNESILSSLADLLLSGKTAQLETSPRVVRLLARRATGTVVEPPGRWHVPAEFVDAAAVDEFRRLVRSQRRGATPPETVLGRSGSWPMLRASRRRWTRGVLRPGRRPARESRPPARGPHPRPRRRGWSGRHHSNRERRLRGRALPGAGAPKGLAGDRPVPGDRAARPPARAGRRPAGADLAHPSRRAAGALGQIAFFRRRARGGTQRPATVAVAGMGYRHFSRQALQQLSPSSPTVSTPTPRR